MPHKLAVASSLVVLEALLLAPMPAGHARDLTRDSARDSAPIHPGPWPIWHWHNHQPRRDQLRAMHKRDLTSEEAREVDRLYWELESPGELAGRTAGFACSYRHHRTCRERAAPHSP
jgi:hypothetical protein